MWEEILISNGIDFSSATRSPESQFMPKEALIRRKVAVSLKDGENTEIGPGLLQLPEDILHLSKTVIVCDGQFNHKYFLLDWLHLYPLLSCRSV